MKRVTGLGGIFFRAKNDTTQLKEWYQKHLGVLTPYYSDKVITSVL
jgi:hypothetical protein